MMRAGEASEESMGGGGRARDGRGGAAVLVGGHGGRGGGGAGCRGGVEEEEEVEDGTEPLPTALVSVAAGAASVVAAVAYIGRAGQHWLGQGGCAGRWAPTLMVCVSAIHHTSN